MRVSRFPSHFIHAIKMHQTCCLTFLFQNFFELCGGNNAKIVIYKRSIRPTHWRKKGPRKRTCKCRPNCYHWSTTTYHDTAESKFTRLDYQYVTRAIKGPPYSACRECKGTG